MSKWVGISTLHIAICRVIEYLVRHYMKVETYILCHYGDAYVAKLIHQNWIPLAVCPLKNNPPPDPPSEQPGPPGPTVQRRWGNQWQWWSAVSWQTLGGSRGVGLPLTPGPGQEQGSKYVCCNTFSIESNLYSYRLMMDCAPKRFRRFVIVKLSSSQNPPSLACSVRFNNQTANSQICWFLVVFTHTFSDHSQSWRPKHWLIRCVVSKRTHKVIKTWL